MLISRLYVYISSRCIPHTFWSKQSIHFKFSLMINISFDNRWIKQLLNLMHGYSVVEQN